MEDVRQWEASVVADLHVAAASADSKTEWAKALSPKILGLQALKPKAPNIKALKQGAVSKVRFWPSLS